MENYGLLPPSEVFVLLFLLVHSEGTLPAYLNGTRQKPHFLRLRFVNLLSSAARAEYSESHSFQMTSLGSLKKINFPRNITIFKYIIKKIRT